MVPGIRGQAERTIGNRGRHTGGPAGATASHAPNGAVANAGMGEAAARAKDAAAPWHQRIPLLRPRIAAIALAAALSWMVVLGTIWLLFHALGWLRV